MREVKFRCWDRVKRCMNNKFVLSSDGEVGSFYGGSFDWNNEIAHLMEYTGLKDKNGIEIYEGDIVSLEDWNPSNMQIAFIEGAFCLANKDGEYVGDIHHIHHAGIERSQVVGNIHENPELLK